MCIFSLLLNNPLVYSHAPVTTLCLCFWTSLTEVECVALAFFQKKARGTQTRSHLTSSWHQLVTLWITHTVCISDTRGHF